MENNKQILGSKL